MEKKINERKIVWFSCGAASAVTAFLNPDAELVYCDTGGEHEDNKRFLRDCEIWLSRKVTVLKNKDFIDHFDVIIKTGYVNGISGARCTVELKKKLRFEFERTDDVQIFGYTVDERHRADRFLKAYPEVNAKFPLIDKNLTKENCLGVLKAAKIKIPEMYLLGFNNNNCIGCVKGGMGYWNHIRKHFPEKFSQMAKIEREVGRSCIKNVWLDELNPASGDTMREPRISCDFICQSVLDD